MAVTPIVLPAVSPSGASRVLASPFQFYLTGAENLLVTSWNTLPAVTLTISMRFLDETGAVTWNTWLHTPNTDRSAKTEAFPLRMGYVLNLVVFAASGAPVIGQTFVKLSIIGGLDHTQYVLGTMLQGYVTSRQELGWPGSPIDSSVMGGGYLSTFLGTRPAAGGEISETVPTGARWELLCVNTTCDCFTPGNRQAYLQLRDIIPGFTMFEAPNPLIVNAAQARWEWGSSVPAPYPGDPFVGVGSLPSPMALTAGQSFGTRTLFIQPADQYGPPIFTVREWLEAQ